MITIQNHDMNYVAKWLNIPAKIFKRLLKQILQYDTKKLICSNVMLRDKLDRIAIMKAKIESYFSHQRHRNITVPAIKEHINADIDQDSNDQTPFQTHEIMHCLKRVMSYSYRRADIRSPKAFLPGCDANRLVFKEFKDRLISLNYVIVYIDECTF